MKMGNQITYDLSDDIQEHGLYGGCWRTPGVQTLAGGEFIQYGPVDKQFTENNHVYGTYDGETGVTLYNKRNTTNVPGCLMRKSRLPIDLSVIDKIEMDIHSQGSHPKAPWYAVWLAPMIYSDRDDNAKAAEIDILENYDQQHRGSDVSSLNSNFAQCGDVSYTIGWCKPSGWGIPANAVNHHVTVTATEEGADGRVIRVHRCPNPAGSPLQTCTSGPFSEIKVTKAPPPGVQKEKWFKVWNKEIAGQHYGHYWFVTDLWWTSNTDFQLSVDNLKFFNNDGSEWKMPLDGAPPKDMLGNEHIHNGVAV